jgi:hypothetical protein
MRAISVADFETKSLAGNDAKAFGEKLNTPAAVPIAAVA